MNIFASDACPVRSAVVLDDQRLIKMILESAQMLGTVFNEAGVEHPYRLSAGHANHPCTVWVRTSFGNVEWLMSHVCALELEYQRRFGQSHRSFRTLPEAFDRFCAITTQRTAQTPPVNAARNRSLNLDFTMYEVHYAYQLYLKTRWELSSPRWRLIPPITMPWA